MRRIVEESEEALDIERSLIPVSDNESSFDVHQLVLSKLTAGVKGKKKII